MQRLISMAGIVLAMLLGATTGCEAADFRPASSPVPPQPTREFRGMWVATVANINWPSKPGLSVQEQQAELTAILDRAVELRLNAVLFQVRPACDSLYASKLEPWSEYLTGVMGQGTKPSYDPLAWVIDAAHQRGLELHAWFNPFRSRHLKKISPVSANHISRRHPEWVRSYGQNQWLDPGEPGVHEYSRNVILDVVRRYDIDGVHLDDYFYPYPESDASGNRIDFPDNSTWKRYVASGGKLSREDWRRDNVNRFLQSLHKAVKSAKPHVKFGISPFGIWRPTFPSQIRGFDAFDQLYADSRKWIAEGWLDYLVPQLYWSIQATNQSFPVLLNWWAGQNPQKRHLWPGISVAGTDGKRTPAEVVAQVRAARKQPGSAGHVLWSAKPLQTDRAGVVGTLRREVYGQPALVPLSPWLDTVPPAVPKVSASVKKRGVQVQWSNPGKEDVFLWMLQVHSGTNWSTQIIPGNKKGALLPSGPLTALAVRAVDRCGNVSQPVILEREKTLAKN